MQAACPLINSPSSGLTQEAVQAEVHSQEHDRAEDRLEARNRGSYLGPVVGAIATVSNGTHHKTEDKMYRMIGSLAIVRLRGVLGGITGIAVW